MKIIIGRMNQDVLRVEIHDDGTIVPNFDYELESLRVELGESAVRLNIFNAIARDPLLYVLAEKLLTPKRINIFMFDCVDHAIKTMAASFRDKKNPLIKKLKDYSTKARAVVDNYPEASVIFHEINHWRRNLQGYDPLSDSHFQKEVNIVFDMTTGLLHSLGYRNSLMGYRISVVDGSIAQVLSNLCNVETLKKPRPENVSIHDLNLASDERAWQLKRLFWHLKQTATGRSRLLPS